MKRVLKMMCLFVAAATLAGCAGTSSGIISIVPVTKNALIEPKYGETDQASVKAAQGANGFALRLSAALSEARESDNFLCSPYSVWLPLAALLNATNEQSRPALLEALGAAGLTAEEVNKAASRMLYELTREQVVYDESKPNKEYRYTPLKIANAIFVDNTVTLKKSFAQAFADYYLGTSANVDFQSPDAVKAVNDWASENTGGLIKDIIQEFDPDTIAAIANAIYFSDTWADKFNPDKTEEGAFNSPSGESKADFMVKQGDGMRYYADDSLQAVSLRFASNASMFILLPKDGDADGLLQSLTSVDFDSIRQGMTNSSGMLKLPKFSIESDVISLKEALVGMGVPLFDKEAAPLSGGLLEEDIGVYASQAVQKAAIKVDEEGTTAAAVTVVMMNPTSMPIQTEPFEMVCDKPFVFILCGSTYDGGDQILFTGVVNKP